LDLWLSKAPEDGEVEEGLNAVLPEGISVVDVRPVPLNASSLEQSIAWMEYEITFPEAEPHPPSQEELDRAVEAFYAESPEPALPVGKEVRNNRNLQRAVKLTGRQEGPGLVCRIHRLSGSAPSAMRVIERLFPLEHRNGLRPRVLKTEAALLAPSPPAVAAKRKLRHGK
jgi:hypothetical protein